MMGEERTKGRKKILKSTFGLSLATFNISSPFSLFFQSIYDPQFALKNFSIFLSDGTEFSIASVVLWGVCVCVCVIDLFILAFLRFFTYTIFPSHHHRRRRHRLHRRRFPTFPLFNQWWLSLSLAFIYIIRKYNLFLPFSILLFALFSWFVICKIFYPSNSHC